MLVGVALFLTGDRIVERRFGSGGAGGAMGIVVGSVVDGVPESIIFGIQLETGLPVSASFLAAFLISAGAATVVGFCLSLGGT
jgi:ZIP family zinc transporter